MDTKDFRFTRVHIDESIDMTVEALEKICKEGWSDSDHQPVYATKAALKALITRMRSWQKMLDDIAPREGG